MMNAPHVRKMTRLHCLQEVVPPDYLQLKKATRGEEGGDHGGGRGGCVHDGVPPALFYDRDRPRY